MFIDNLTIAGTLIAIILITSLLVLYKVKEQTKNLKSMHVPFNDKRKRR